MGKINQGILGGFSGQVGTVIGGSWKGKSYMRARAVSFKDPKTQRQMAHRTKFGFVQRSLRPMTHLLRVGFKLYAQGQSAHNAAMSYAFANAVSGTYPDYVLNYAAILISRGGLTPAANALATGAGSSIKFTWTDNSGAGAAKQTDMALIAVVNPAKGEAVSFVEDAMRMEGSQTVSLSNHWLGDVVHTYLGFVSEDEEEVSNSLYLGQITVGESGNASNPGNSGNPGTPSNPGGSGNPGGGSEPGDDEDIDPDA